MKVTNTQLRNLILSETRRALSEGRKKPGIASFPKDVASEIIAAWDNHDSQIEDFFVSEAMYSVTTAFEGYEDKEKQKIFRKLDEEADSLTNSVVKEMLASKYLKQLLTKWVSSGIMDAAEDLEGTTNFRSASAPDANLTKKDLRVIAQELSDQMGKTVKDPYDIDYVQDPVYQNMFAIRVDNDTYMYDVESGRITPKKFKTWPPKARQ